MITFWIVAGLLIAAALLFVIPPLISRDVQQATVVTSELNLSIYRDQLRELDAELVAGTLDEAQYRNARSELEVQVIEDVNLPETALVSAGGRWHAVVVGLAVPLLAISLYMVLGNSKGIDSNVVANTPAASGAPHAISPAQIQAMTKRLEERLEKQPNDADGWAILARSYGSLQRYEESGAAYARALELQPNNAQLLADYADVLAMSNERSLQGEPEIIIQRALKADPSNLKALALAGTVAYERKDFQGAINHWQKILSLVPVNSQIASSVNASLNEVRKLMGQKPVDMQQQTSNHATDQVAAQNGVIGASVSGVVSLAPALKSQVADTDTVFIFARAVAAKRGPPLAIMRKTVKDLPITFTLDDSMAMAPNVNLSSASQVVIGARISKSGNAMPSQGDLEGYSSEIPVGAIGIDVSISSKVN